VVEAAGVSLTTGGQHSAADGARAHVASGGACANAGANRARVYATKKRVVRWSRDVNGEDKISLSFFYFFFGESTYVDEGRRPVGRSATQLATSGLADAERTPMVEH
jgi:hypothetical protein